MHREIKPAAGNALLVTYELVLGLNTTQSGPRHSTEEHEHAVKAGRKSCENVRYSLQIRIKANWSYLKVPKWFLWSRHCYYWLCIENKFDIRGRHKVIDDRKIVTKSASVMAGPSDMFVLIFANLNKVDPGSSGGRKAELALGWNKYAWIITYRERNGTGRGSDTEKTRWDVK